MVGYAFADSINQTNTIITNVKVRISLTGTSHLAQCLYVTTERNHIAEDSPIGHVDTYYTAILMCCRKVILIHLTGTPVSDLISRIANLNPQGRNGRARRRFYIPFIVISHWSMPACTIKHKDLKSLYIVRRNAEVEALSASLANMAQPTVANLD